MSRKQYTPQFKARLVLEVLKGEKDFGETIVHDVFSSTGLDLETIIS